MSEPAVIEVDHVSVRYQTVEALRDVSLRLGAGRIVGVLGPNGAGKSSLLRAMLGLTPIQSGRITILGASGSAAARQVAYVAQRTAVDWDFPITVRDVVAQGRWAGRRPWSRLSREDDAIIAASLDRIGLGALADRRISELSGGQQQRTFVARALARQSPVLLMDEPFAGVDAVSEAAIMEVVREQRARGTTVVVVHHDLHTATRYFDEVVLLRHRVVAHGPPSDVMKPEVLSDAYGNALFVMQDQRVRDGGPS
jgi:ABC-type Mn2+/Zn2+ transport system ATPase subunit